MRIKSEQTRQPALPRRRLHGLPDHRLMARMDPVENPQRQMQRLSQRGEFIQAVPNQHSAAITASFGFFKPHTPPTK